MRLNGVVVGINTNNAKGWADRKRKIEAALKAEYPTYTIDLCAFRNASGAVDYLRTTTQVVHVIMMENELNRGIPELMSSCEELAASMAEMKHRGSAPRIKIEHGLDNVRGPFHTFGIQIVCGPLHLIFRALLCESCQHVAA